MRVITVMSLLLAALPLTAQTSKPTVHTAADLAQREARLIGAAKADPKGVAADYLDNFSNAQTLLIVRVKTGPAERHKLWADQMVILKGTVTLVTGTAMQAETANAKLAGESTGAAVEGKEVVLHAGDIAHVSAGVAHWVKLAPGATATYLVFKEK